MNQVALVYPHQLFDSHPALSKGRTVWLLEDPLFFRQYRFHLRKLVYHRVTMEGYADRLRKKGYEVKYISHDDPLSETQRLFENLTSEGITSVHLCDPVDYLLERRLKRYATRNGLTLDIHPSPGFICNTDRITDYFKGRKRFFLTDFYIDERKRSRTLLRDGEPEGGKWTYDTENRKRMPKGTVIPPLPSSGKRASYNRVVDEMKKAFPDAPGDATECVYPVDPAEASVWLDRFLENRFSKYGDYQDAIVEGQPFLFHSIITPMLNTGLLLPDQVLERAIDSADKYDVPLNALEGFVRQIMGWREFIRAVYQLRGVEQRKKNFWGHTRKIPASFYTGETGIPPVDDAIRKTLKYGYTHHIERLMVLGNFMVLCEFDPDEVYRWFMELYIDAYDWVMVPNVYGMSQFADGGIMSTKPYISGSNYILKMSDYAKGDWCEVWDALFWRFIVAHRDFFLKNPRLSMMARQADKMDKARLNRLLDRAETYLASLS
ncbi:MAG: cryptochrome/photolyase family protein [Bacteroidota bacterium]